MSQELTSDQKYQEILQWILNAKKIIKQQAERIKELEEQLAKAERILK